MFSALFTWIPRLRETIILVSKEKHLKPVEFLKDYEPVEVNVKFNPENIMKRCIIYSRVSTADQETQNQTSQLNEFAEKQGWSIVDVITDICSGSKGLDDRSGLNAVFTRAHKKQFDVLLFWSLDRLSREGSRKTIEYLTRMEDYGIGWHSFTEQYLSSMGPFSDCIISLLSTLARQERIRISERTKAGLERTKRVCGTKLGRPRVSRDRIDEVRQLRGQGLTFKLIAEKIGVTPVRAYQLWKY